MHGIHIPMVCVYGIYFEWHRWEMQNVCYVRVVTADATATTTKIVNN